MNWVNVCWFGMSRLITVLIPGRVAILYTGDIVYWSSWRWLEESEWDVVVDKCLSQKMILYSLVCRCVQEYKVAEQSLEVNQDEVIELLLDDDLHDNNFWWIVLERGRRLKLNVVRGTFVLMWFYFFFNFFLLLFYVYSFFM